MFNISRIAALHPPQLSTSGELDAARLPQPPGRESRFQHAKGTEMTPQRHLLQPMTPRGVNGGLLKQGLYGLQTI
jgi:hypothetical protein